MRVVVRLLACCAVACVALYPRPAGATTIDPLLFEELVLGADFVGVVECETAGGVVAGYRVIESWKGPGAGTKILVRTAVNYWEPQYPLALCGERYFMTAFAEAPTRVLSTTSGGGVPLWWRDLPADYRLPLFQGRELLPPGGDRSPAFEKTRRDAKALLALTPDGREAALLAALVRHDLFGPRWVGGEPDEAKAKVIRDRLAKQTTADRLAEDLVRLAREDRAKWAVRVRIVLGKGGSAAALAALQKLTPDESPWPRDELAALVDEVKRRGGRADPIPPPKMADPDPVPTAAVLADLRRALAAGPAAGEASFGEAFLALTRHDPGPAAEYLLTWRNPGTDWRDADRGYVLGSYFGWRCGRDRAAHLTRLLAAADPYVRVAAAVYLGYEDPAAGVAALRRFTALEGDPGAWAALTLARRGHRDAVPRALEVFRELPPERREAQAGMAGVPHRNLQKRVIELLSNAARAGGVPPPVVPEAEGRRFDALVGWWKEHGGRAVVADPWFATLERQKVD